MTQLIRGVILLMCVSIWGCSTANDNPVDVTVSGKHPAGWAVASNGGSHPALFLSAPDKCKECHGTDLLGGITKVSCSSTSCHAQGPYGHAPGWNAYTAHGAHAKAAAAGVNGMAFCKNCHGANYTGGVGKSCMTAGCHNSPAPHPATPWKGLLTTHATTDPSNAPVCAQCHIGGAFLTSSVNPSSTGISGCFNNTLCHGVKGHTATYPGATHKSVGFDFGPDCLVCHTAVTPGAVYPATAGTPPVCSSCHPGWASSPAIIGCGGCHGDPNPLGSDGYGQPTGSTFPNFAGQHRRHSNVGIATCAYCHSGGGTGASAHGNANRTVKTVQDVIILKDPGLAEPISISKNASTGVVTCNGTCHSKGHSAETW